MESGFVPFNPLEEELMGAATDPSRRPSFYRLLLDSKLFVLTPDSPAKEQTMVLAAQTRVRLLPFQGPGGVFIPVFSSFERLREFLYQTRGVRRAWLAQVLIASRSPEPSLLIAVECVNEAWSELKGRIGLVASDAARAVADPRPIDLVRYGDGPFDDYLSNAAPVYER